MNKIYKIVIGGLFILSLLVTTKSFAQQYVGNESPWYVGGSLGLSFGNVTSISIMPELAYAVTEDFFVGGGFNGFG